MANTRKATGTRTRRAPKPAVAQGVDGFEPVHLSGNGAGEVREDDRMPLFYVDDDEYTIPNQLPPAVGLRYLRNLRNGGRDYAVAELLVEVLGENGFNALSSCDGMTSEQMLKIVEMVTFRALGGVDQGKR